MKSTNSRPITAFIVGAGAVEGAWGPILDALQPYHDFPLTPDGANAFLARLVYLLRWWSTCKSENAPSELIKCRKFLIEIRNAICRALKKAEEKGRIKVRAEFEDIVLKNVLYQSSGIMLVTTNWDNVIGKALKRLLNTPQFKFECRPLHIHGSTKTPDVMYLPTEMTIEPYRTRDEEKIIGNLHGAIWRGLEGCHRSVVYGLSISPLDAELGQILACGWDNPVLKEIEIIAPDHDVIAHRVNLLLARKKDIAVKGYNPSNLKEYTDYSIIRHSS